MTRQINNKIKTEYQHQITTQQEVCKLYICDFLENKYDFYCDIDDFLEDSFDFEDRRVSSLSHDELNRYVKNHSIPIKNITRSGVEKGILLKFKNSESYTSSLYDLKKRYTKAGIEDWIQEEKVKFANKGFELIDVIYWGVRDYSLKTCGFNESEWKTLLDASSKLWNLILEERKLSDKEVKEKYDKLEIIEGHELSSEARNTKKYVKRNLRKRKRNEPPKVIYKF